MTATRKDITAIYSLPGKSLTIFERGQYFTETENGFQLRSKGGEIVQALSKRKPHHVSTDPSDLPTEEWFLERERIMKERKG